MIERWFPRPLFSLTGVACVFGQTSRRFLSDEAATASPRNQKYFLSSRHRTWRFTTSDRIEVISRSTTRPPPDTTYYRNKYREKFVLRSAKEWAVNFATRLSIDRDDLHDTYVFNSLGFSNVLLWTQQIWDYVDSKYNNVRYFMLLCYIIKIWILFNHELHIEKYIIRIK